MLSRNKSERLLDKSFITFGLILWIASLLVTHLQPTRHRIRAALRG